MICLRNKIKIYFLSILFLFFLSDPSRGQQTSIKEKITSVENSLLPQLQFQDEETVKFNIYDRMKAYHVPSVSIAVINNGEIEWAKAYGIADKELGTPATLSTLYQAASMSKSINALAVMKLVEEGELSLNKDIRTYLKTWKLPENDFSRNNKITLRNLLSHTAGLSTSGFDGYTKHDSVPGINQILNGEKPANSPPVKPLSPPNLKFQYSGGGIVLAEKILLETRDEDYEQILQKEVLRPLKMTNSTFVQDFHSAEEDLKASGHDTQGNAIEGKYHLYPEHSAAGLWTTPTDYAKFIIAIQKSLKGEEKSILNKETAEKMIKHVIDSSDAALGFFVYEHGGERYFTHGGSNKGFKSNYHGGLDSGVGVVVMANSDQHAILQEIINSVAFTYAWKNYYSPEKRELIKLPEERLRELIGSYTSSEGNDSVRIRKAKKNLELSLNDAPFEKIFFTEDNSFMVYSAPNLNWNFSFDHRDRLDTFTLNNGEETVSEFTKVMK